MVQVGEVEVRPVDAVDQRFAVGRQIGADGGERVHHLARGAAHKRHGADVVLARVDHLRAVAGPGRRGQVGAVGGQIARVRAGRGHHGDRIGGAFIAVVRQLGSIRREARAGASHTRRKGQLAEFGAAGVSADATTAASSSTSNRKKGEGQPQPKPNANAHADNCSRREHNLHRLAAVIPSSHAPHVSALRRVGSNGRAAGLRGRRNGRRHRWYVGSGWCGRRPSLPRGLHGHPCGQLRRGPGHASQMRVGLRDVANRRLRDAIPCAAIMQRGSTDHLQRARCSDGRGLHDPAERVRWLSESVTGRRKLARDPIPKSQTDPPAGR
jgi:hypothetical protein